MIAKLSRIQAELKAPKNQRNNFGNYNYRSCEDILEAVKPLLAREGLVLTITDSIEMIGGRYYVKATATVTDGEKEITTSAYAREADTKKGMDESQITGAASSYARKYTLNGLFCIDDTKDADTMDNTSTLTKKAKPTAKADATKAEAGKKLRAGMAAAGIDTETVKEISKLIYQKPLADLTADEAADLAEHLSDYNQMRKEADDNLMEGIA